MKREIKIVWKLIWLFKKPKVIAKHYTLRWLFWKQINLQPIRCLTNRSQTQIYTDLRTARETKLNSVFLLTNRQSFHTFRFQINYDLIMTDRIGNVLVIKTELTPNYFATYYPTGYYLYFLPAGFLRRHAVQCGDSFITSRRQILN